MSETTCRHERYHDGRHMTGKKIARLTKSRGTKPEETIAWYSERITSCHDCGADISEYDIHEFMTAEEYVAKHCVTPEPEKEKRVIGNERIAQAKQKLRNHQAKAEAAGQGSMF